MPICLFFDGDIALARYDICGILMNFVVHWLYASHFAAAFVDWIYITDCIHVILQLHLFAGYMLNVFMYFVGAFNCGIFN